MATLRPVRTSFGWAGAFVGEGLRLHGKGHLRGWVLALWCGATAWSQQPSDAPALDQAFQAAASAYHAGRYAEAAAGLERLAQTAPKSFEVHELLGMAYGAESEDTRAVEQLRLATSLAPQSAAARTNLATALVRIGRPKEAEAEWRSALALEPGSYDANQNLAELYLRENRIADALPLLKTSHRLRPEAGDNGYDLALAELLLGQLGEARATVAAVAAQHDSGDLHSVLGRVDEKEGKYVDAANEFGVAARMDPSEDNLFVWASELLLHRAYEASIDVFHTATQRYPKSPRLWIGLGMAHYSRGEYQPAIQSLLTAADLDPGDPRAYVFLSKAFLSSPSQAEAVIERFRRYAELQPNNALAQYDYAIGVWKGRRVANPDVDYKAVEALLLRSIALNGDDAQVHLQLGILYNDEREYAKSLPEYQRALALDPNLADAHFRLARYFLRAGEKERAKGEFDRFQQLQAQHQAAVDKERAEVQQFVISTGAPAPARP